MHERFFHKVGFIYTAAAFAYDVCERTQELWWFVRQGAKQGAHSNSE